MSIPALSIILGYYPLMDMFLNSVLIAMNNKNTVSFMVANYCSKFSASLFLIPSYGFISAAYIALFSY